jgi:hypothetical protein
LLLEVPPVNTHENNAQLFLWQAAAHVVGLMHHHQQHWQCDMSAAGCRPSLAQLHGGFALGGGTSVSCESKQCQTSMQASNVKQE